MNDFVIVGCRETAYGFVILCHYSFFFPEVRVNRLSYAVCLIYSLCDELSRGNQVSSLIYIYVGVKLYKQLKINMVFLYFCSLIFTDTCLFVKYVVSLQSKIVIWITHWKFKIIG